MKPKLLPFAGVAVLLSACSTTEVKRPPASGVIETGRGGAVGYQHGIDRSKFAIGASRRNVNEFGFVKVVGSDGTFAVDETNGLAIGIPNANSTQGQATAWYTRTPEQHNQLVLDYLIGAGIAKDQVGGVHATMSLSARANRGQVPASQPPASQPPASQPPASQPPASQPTIGGYQSVLDRRIGDIPVVDSVAWARMNDQGAVLAEWVYWPAIASGVIADARRMRETLSRDSGRGAFLAKIPGNLPLGSVVIRHSSATAKGAFEAFASYDVLERRPGPGAVAEPRPTGASRAVSIVRHFDADGNERRLPQEKRNMGADYPVAKRPSRNVPTAR